MSNEDYRAALDSLYKARHVWPEYFGTDFLIALSLEKIGDTHKAARFYKGYLDKLKTLESGDFPISAPLIQALNIDAADRYYSSMGRIKYHLEQYNIDLADIKLPLFIPAFVKIVFLLFLMLALGIVAHYTLIPYLKMRNRIKNVTPGYWLCRKCGEVNSNLSTTCAKCGFSKE